MRIACIFNYPPHYRASIYRLMDSELGCDFYFGANIPGTEPIKKMDVGTLKGFKRESRVFSFRYLWQCGYPWLSLRKYDAFIATGDPRVLSSLLLLLVCKVLGKPVFLWSQGLRRPDMRLRPHIRWFLRNADGWFLYGDYGKQVMAEWGIDRRKLHVIYNSLDYDKQLGVRAYLASSEIYQKHFGNHDPVLAFVGRLTPQKKLFMVLHAVANLLAAGVPTNAVFIGTGSEEGQLRELAGKLGIAKRVWFYGATHQEEEIGQLLYDASACISPGEIGLTAMHALAYGCPVVTHSDPVEQMPECEAVVNGQTGYLFEHGNQKSLEDAVIKLLRLAMTDRAELRANCYRIVEERYNPHRQIAVIKAALGLGR